MRSVLLFALPALIPLTAILSGAQDIEALLAKVPAKARAKKNPLADDAEAPMAGKKLFARHCAECHGVSADGSRRGPNLRVSEIAQAAPGEIFWILTNGVVRSGMPSWSKLPETQRWQIISFLGGLSRIE
jgi:mono/diheme cytochrome c family protein